MGDGEDLGVMAAAERDDLRARCAVLARELDEVRGALARAMSTEAGLRARLRNVESAAAYAAEVRAIARVRLARELRGLADEIEGLS